MSGRPSLAAREQAPSGFFIPLKNLCETLPALATALVDGEGETVDFACESDAYAIKVAAAELQLIVASCSESAFAGFRALDQFTVRARGATLAAVPLSPDYILVIHLPRRVFSMSQRAVSEAVRLLCAEGGFAMPKRYRGEQWMRVFIRDDASIAHRPLSIRTHNDWQMLNVMGRILGTPPGEIAYRVQLLSGQEANLVREPLGKWFSDRLLGL